MFIDSLYLNALYWTKIGAIGSWVGSIFGLAAFVVAIVSLVLPNMIRVSTTLTLKNVFELNNDASKDQNVCSIVVKNCGLKLINIEQIYVSVGRKGTLFSAGVISDGSSVEKNNEAFPFRINSGDKKEYFVPLDDLLEFVYSKEDSKLEEKLYIVIDETTKGKMYFKTGYSLKDLILEKRKGQINNTGR